MALDNVANLPQWLSDALCRMASGAGWATRRLYTDAEEEVFKQSRLVLITGIEDYVTNGDLLDRTILVGLPTIHPRDRRPEAELVEDFNRLQPQIFGALLDAVSKALRNLPNVHPNGLPRMADFAIWVIAAEESLSWPAGTFLAAYSEAANAANDVVLDASLIAGPVRQLAATGGGQGWTGTATQLLDALGLLVTDEIKKKRRWPTTGQVVSGMLRRLAPTLRAVGVDVVFLRDQTAARQRLITIAQDARPQTVQTVQTVQTEPAALDGDKTDAGTLDGETLFGWEEDESALDVLDGLDGVLRGTSAPLRSGDSRALRVSSDQDGLGTAPLRPGRPSTASQAEFGWNEEIV